MILYFFENNTNVTVLDLSIPIICDKATIISKYIKKYNHQHKLLDLDLYAIQENKNIRIKPFIERTVNISLGDYVTSYGY